MQFSIGQVSRMFGFTRQAVRFYEEKGLIKPVKDAVGRRYYDENAIARLISARKYLAMGYQISEVVKQFSASTPESIAETLDRKYAETNEKIQHLMMVAATIDEYRGKIRALPELMGKFVVRQSPPLAFFYSQPDNVLQEDLVPDTMVWVDALPVSKITAFYDGRQMQAHLTMKRKHKGFSIDLHQAGGYGLLTLKTTQCISERLCAHTVLAVRSEEIASLNVADETLSFLSNAGLEMDGDPWGQIIFSDSNQDKPHEVKPYRQYIDLWLPVKKIE
ncbi:MerR family transcriptional regulator [Anoxynatronum buryatiense]|uniref:DNA-binding transcriptional regulator, MerR family n=1 Tax=Anoxynatronum buryatiense TaxID=489973 RepID=A0AA46AII5_9CLOT|nr:MerR family transcriptional regulator [Anoxynatronum buryatiense]SMP51013.1 DNA-binding transcriptional regulator, MerR family [Anoxynatronum buryatiense]